MFPSTKDMKHANYFVTQVLLHYRFDAIFDTAGLEEEVLSVITKLLKEIIKNRYSREKYYPYSLFKGEFRALNNLVRQVHRSDRHKLVQYWDMEMAKSIEAMFVERSLIKSDGKTSLNKYLEVGTESIAVTPSLAVVLVFFHVDLTKYISEIAEINQLAAMIIRIANDYGTYNRELLEGNKNLVGILSSCDNKDIIIMDTINSMLEEFRSKIDSTIWFNREYANAVRTMVELAVSVYKKKRSFRDANLSL